MTNEEAKERFKWHKPYLTDESWKECYQLAIEALEKQMPMKPTKTPLDDDGLCYEDHCASCGAFITTFSHCHRCGQSLDWSDDDD